MSYEITFLNVKISDFSLKIYQKPHRGNPGNDAKETTLEMSYEIFFLNAGWLPEQPMRAKGLLANQKTGLFLDI